MSQFDRFRCQNVAGEWWGSAQALDVVGGEHARASRPLHCAEHPALVDGLHAHDHVPIPEGHLVMVLRRVVIDGPVGSLHG